MGKLATKTPDPVLRYKIKELREKAGLAQTELAKLANLSSPVICQWESGRMQRISTSRLIQVANVLGVEPEDLFEVVD